MHIVAIGGSDAGISAALRAHETDPGADPWAIAEAMPSDEEIGRVKRLIERVKADLDDLTEQERAEVQQAAAMVRRFRTVMLGMPHTHPGTPRPAADGSV